MENNDNKIINARNEFFNKLRKKNEINHSRIEELDLDNIGVVLNYQQIDLMTFALGNNKIGYKKYQDNLLPINEFFTDESKKIRNLLVIKDLINDELLPIKVRDTFKRIYDETKNNQSISNFLLMKTMNKLTSKLSIDLQHIIFGKFNGSYRIAKEGIKEMSYDESLKLFSYIDNDFSSITLGEVTSYKIYVNYNGFYNKNDFEKMLKFCYENDKHVRINVLTNYDSFPDYLYKQSKEIVKQKLLTYVDDITRYIKNYNITHKRIDRKPFIRSIDVFSDLITDVEPFEWRGNLKDVKESGWQSILSLEDLCDVIKVARNNLPDIDFVYNENKLEKQAKRIKVMEVLNAIKLYENKHKVKLIDTIGIKLHLDLNILNEDVINMFQDFSNLKMPISITEFDLCATYDMIANNNNLEIEILRDRFISDLCNIITNIQMSKTIKFDSISIDSITDIQNPLLTSINIKRQEENLPLLKTIYGGMYSASMDKKDDIIKEKSSRKDKNKEKGIAETAYLFIIVLILMIIITIVSYIFVKLI